MKMYVVRGCIGTGRALVATLRANGSKASRPICGMGRPRPSRSHRLWFDLRGAVLRLPAAVSEVRDLAKWNRDGGFPRTNALAVFSFVNRGDIPEWCPHFPPPAQKSQVRQVHGNVSRRRGFHRSRTFQCIVSVLHGASHVSSDIE